MTDEGVWLTAQYHMPATYSIRMPASSPFTGRTLPAPGPATVQLAMIRTAIELFGAEYTCKHLFPHIVSSCPRVQPPLRVGISDQLSSVLKASAGGGLGNSIGYREVCHAEGPICASIRVPMPHVDRFRKILMAIGYWGRSDGFAHCTDVQVTEPVAGSYAVAFESLTLAQASNRYFSSFVTELRGAEVEWSEVISDDLSAQSQFVLLRLYVWPLVPCEHYGAGRNWRYFSLV
jgi:hypothetical protein